MAASEAHAGVQALVRELKSIEDDMDVQRARHACRMDRWSLRFGDPQLEKQYCASTFANSALVLLAGATTLGVVSVVLPMLFPAAKMAGPFGWGCLVMAAGRAWLHSLDDQYAASLHFGHAHLIVCIACVIAIIAALLATESRAPTNTEVGFMMVMALNVKTLERYSAVQFHANR